MADREKAELIKEYIEELEKGGVRFRRLIAIFESLFGPPRNTGSSHYIFKTRWHGDPRINFQETTGGAAKPYQINQAISALHKLLDIIKVNED